MKVLLLTASYGDGHHQVASALADAFSRYGADVREFDCIRADDPGRTKTSRVFGEWLYESITRFAPWLYGVSYNWTRNLGQRHPLWWLLSLPLRDKLRGLLEDFEPDVVLQLFPERVLSDLKLSADEPYVGMVVTDYSVHTRWYHRRVDTYFLPTADMIGPALRFAGAEGRCLATGIPLRRQFCSPDGDSLPGGSPLSDDRRAPYVLVAAGGRGLFPDLEVTLSRLSECLPDHHVYVMCGKNEGMLAKVKRLSEGTPHLVGLPFVTDVATWYHHASFAVVKAGGLTVSECLAMACPMLLYRPQAGQEYDNALYVESVGAGRVVRKASELPAVLSAFADADIRADMRAACRKHSHPNAAIDVVHAVMAAQGRNDTGNK